MIHEIYSTATIGSILLLLLLIYVFIQDYQKVKSRFTLGLVIFAAILLVNAIFSCPLFFGSCYACLYEPYHAIAAVFQFLALVILVYLVTR